MGDLSSPVRPALLAFYTHRITMMRYSYYIIAITFIVYCRGGNRFFNFGDQLVCFIISTCNIIISSFNRVSSFRQVKKSSTRLKHCGIMCIPPLTVISLLGRVLYDTAAAAVVINNHWFRVQYNLYQSYNTRVRRLLLLLYNIILYLLPTTIKKTNNTNTTTTVTGINSPPT